MKTPDPETLRQTYFEQLTPHVPEPIQAIGFLSPAGLMKDLVKGQVARGAVRQASPLLGILMGRKQKKDRMVAPTTQLVAVTATGVFLFPMPPNGSTFQVQAAPTAWSRSQIRVTADERGRTTQKVHVDHASGARDEFEISEFRNWVGFSTPMLDLLCATVAA